MRRLDRPGIFRARPLSWSVRTSETSQAVAISIEFAVLAQLEASSWTSWAEYEEHRVYGQFYVIKRDGSVNQTVVEQLAGALGWNGDLRTVAGPVPDVTVQITVKEDAYNGQVRFKADWINPGDHTPQVPGASQGEVGTLQARFGSLLRAAAAGARSHSKPSAPPVAKAKAARDDVARNPISDEPMDDDAIPF
ncbi:MAG: hypothetical protein AB7T63_08050 [Planctomycetota bacterium]